jgi:FkbM family methyltransferase
MSSATTYRPYWFKLSKYSIYWGYFQNYIKNLDFISLRASFLYALTGRLPKKDYVAKSDIGKFLIRKHSTDFQFINVAYERKVKKYIQDNLDNFDVFFDCGACIGEYCIWLAGKNKRCIAFEPVNGSAIISNIDLNPGAKQTIKLFRCAVGDTVGDVYFNIPQTGVLGSSHLVQDSAKEPNATINKIDNLAGSFDIKETDRILMKFDVEGHEPAAFRGATEFIRGHKNISIIYEHFSLDDYRNDKALSEIANFKFSDIDGVNRVAVKVD